MGDLPDIIGTVSIGFNDGAPSLVFTGPDVPGLSGVGTTMTLSYDAEKHRVQVNAGLSAGDDSMTVDLTSLPEEWQRLVQRAQGSRTSRVTLPTPTCASLQTGDGFISYADYRQMARAGRGPAPAAGTFNPFDVNAMRRAAAAVLYPPLTRAMFDRLVARCRGRQILGM